MRILQSLFKTPAINPISLDIIKNYHNSMTLQYDNLSDSELETVILENLGDPSSKVAIDISEYSLHISEYMYRKYFWFFEQSIIIDRYQSNDLILSYNPEKIFCEITGERNFSFEKARCDGWYFMRNRPDKFNYDEWYKKFSCAKIWEEKDQWKPVKNKFMFYT